MTQFVSKLVTEIRKASPNGGFVRKDEKTGRWYEVGLQQSILPRWLNSFLTTLFDFDPIAGWGLSCQGKEIPGIIFVVHF